MLDENSPLQNAAEDELFGVDEAEAYVILNPVRVDEEPRAEAETDASEAPVSAREDANSVPSGATGYLRAFMSRWMAPAMVIIGIALAGQSVFRIDIHISRDDASLATLGGVRAALSQPSHMSMPSELIVYGEEQYQNFVQGIIRFSDADLLEYAATTLRDMGEYNDPMTPFMLDVLFLTHREIQRRGLSRPMVSVAYEQRRESFQAMLQQL